MLEGWFFITAALLALSGGAKIRDPEPTRGALAAARLPSGRLVVFGLGVLEVAAAVASLVGLAIGAWLVALLYIGFSGFVGLALVRRLPIQSCGCFGKVDTPPFAGHLVLNLSAAAAAIYIAVTGGRGLAEVLSRQPALGLPYLGFGVLAVFLVGLILSELPKLGRRRRGIPS